MTADVYGNIIYGNNAKGNNRDTLFHLGLLSFWLHTAFFTSCPCLLFYVSKHSLKASALSAQVPKFKSIKRSYRLQKILRGSKQELHSSVMRVLQALARTKWSPLSLEVHNLKHHYSCFSHSSFSARHWPSSGTGHSPIWLPLEPAWFCCRW